MFLVLSYLRVIGINLLEAIIKILSRSNHIFQVASQIIPPVISLEAILLKRYIFIIVFFTCNSDDYTI